MAFGVVQLGLAAAHVRNAALAQECINRLARDYWSTGMASFHDARNLFNTDISGGFPYLCAATLVYGDPGLVRLFPARPPQWPRGTLKGVRLRGAITVEELSWSPAGGHLTLRADRAQTTVIEFPNGRTQTVTLPSGEPREFDFDAPEAAAARATGAN